MATYNNVQLEEIKRQLPTYDQLVERVKILEQEISESKGVNPLHFLRYPQKIDCGVGHGSCEKGRDIISTPPAEDQSGRGRRYCSGGEALWVSGAGSVR